MAHKGKYHHGDLRQALLAASLEMLEEGGIQALSLRKVATRIGVSHAAPEHHFPAFRDLLTAMAAEGFALLAASMRAAMTRAGPLPQDQIRAALDGYLAYATGHPHLFRLMFTADLLDWQSEALGRHAAEARAVLSEICRPVAEARGVTDPGGQMAIEQLVWAYAHGHAHLVIDQKLGPEAGIDCPPPAKPLDLASLLFPSPA